MVMNIIIIMYVFLLVGTREASAWNGKAVEQVEDASSKKMK